METGTERYQKLVDHLVKMSQSCGNANAVRRGCIPGAEACAAAVNEILQKLDEAEREALAAFVLATYRAGIYDVLDHLEWLRVCHGLTVAADGETLPLGEYEGLSGDYVGRCAGREWPQEETK